MNNLYHKIAVGSFSIALSLTLGANKEAKAATLSLAPTTIFGVADFNQDELGDAVFQNSILDVGLVGRNTENQQKINGNLELSTNLISPIFLLLLIQLLALLFLGLSVLIISHTIVFLT